MASVVKPILRFAYFALVAGLAGCGGSPQSRMSRYDQAFSTAPPELKAQWDAAFSAVKSKDYAVALAALDKLSVMTNLAPKQAEAIREVSSAVSDEMYDAANKGDTKAKQSIEDLRKMRGR